MWARMSVIGIGWKELDLLQRIDGFASKTTPSFRTLTGLSKTFICNIICNTSREKKKASKVGIHFNLHHNPDFYSHGR